ncbi:hypothetical protein EB796_017476 [Bugula neritina]|uniref:Riboflavin transporter n=1 Tax=Bugula neritina TaxID=10212 RepID=A0A7J7JF21_BUGNE|nr:hypothetical protein EB796_017476 [Bugula neritina]
MLIIIMTTFLNKYQLIDQAHPKLIMNVKTVITILLFIVFGWSSWIDVNGLWVELPVMVHQLPEGWNLPSYFTVMIQLANIGPLAYGLVKYLCRRRPLNSEDGGLQTLETVTIFIITGVGMLATLLLAFFWHETSFIGGVEHSTVLLVLVFFLSLVDCTSSVTFLPFLSRFKAIYMTPFYIGEGLSGLLPTALAFIQGSGEYSCVNQTTNGTSSIQPNYYPLLFPVQDFFVVLCCMLSLSILAFIVLRYSGYCRSEVCDKPEYLKGYQSSNTGSERFANSTVTESQATLPVVDSGSPMISGGQKSGLTTVQYFSLLGVMALVSCLANGALPSIQIYSLLPYGQLYYSLGVKLAMLANPLACFLGFCAFRQSFIVLNILTAVAMASAAYIIVIASYSPTPPVEGVAGAVFMVLVWIIFTAVVSYLKVYISSILLKKGHSALFWAGVVTQVGSCVGAIVAFICTTVAQLFTPAPFLLNVHLPNVSNSSGLAKYYMKMFYLL